MSETEYLEKYDAQKPHRNDTDIVFYGLSAVKSAAAVQIAHQLGFHGLAENFAHLYSQWFSIYTVSKKKVNQNVF